MPPSVSVTMPIEEYQRSRTSLEPKGVILLCVISFCTGLVVGLIEVSDDRTPPRNPAPIIENVEPSASPSNIL